MEAIVSGGDREETKVLQIALCLLLSRPKSEIAEIILFIGREYQRTE